MGRRGRRASPSAFARARRSALADAELGRFPSYPLMCALNSRRVLYGGAMPWTGVLPANLAGPWQAQAPNTYHPERYYASAVCHAPGRFMKIGGDLDGSEQSPTRRCSLYDAATGLWSPGPDLAVPHLHHNTVTLPDEGVLVVGGRTRTPQGVMDFVKRAELWYPGMEGFTQVDGDMADPRPYHAVAALMRDARVVAAGGEYFPTAQIYRPPYFNTDQTRRPVITSAPAQIPYRPGAGQAPSLEIKWESAAPATIARVCLIALASVTHGFDQNQRRVELEFGEDSSNTILILGPRDAWEAPPGWYLLFIVNELGMPSVAAYVHVG